MHFNFKALLLFIKLQSIIIPLWGCPKKDVRSQGGGSCPVRTFCGQGDEGFSDADVCTF